MSKLDQATLARIHSVRIHPPIGIARVGNSTADDGWFYGPEIPGRIDTPHGGFKDATGAVKRQVSKLNHYFVQMTLIELATMLGSTFSSVWLH